MAIRQIRTDTDPILRKHSREVTSFDERLNTLIDDMNQTVQAADGVGLAAVQVGVLRRVIVIDIDNIHYELVNPEIIETNGEQISDEACLSLPRRFGKTKRPLYVKVKAQDRHGEWHEYEGTEMLAKCFCHEIDHLDGILYPDRLIPGEKLQIEES